MLDLFCIGGSSIDLVLKVPRLPQHDEKLVADFRGSIPGGLIANTACAASKLGLKVGWTGQVGDDAFGKTFLDDFLSFGVDFSSVIVHTNATTDFCVILVEPGGERTILVVPTLKGPPPVSQIARLELANAKIVYLMPQEINWFKNMAEAVSQGNGKIALDIEANAQVKQEDLLEILPLTQIVFCNASGLQFASGHTDLLSGAQKLLGFGVETVVVTQGHSGASVITKDQFLSSQPFRVSAVDTTGAGDCFHAAFIKGMLSDWGLQYCLDFANAAAALSIQHEGARGGIPAQKDVETFLYQYRSVTRD